MENKCSDCSKCCEWPGVLEVHQNDIETISRFLSISVTEFIASYLEPDNDNFGHYIVKSKNDNACIFLVNGLCSIYKVRPKACVDFPREDQITESLKLHCNLSRSLKHSKK